ncbi:adhesion G protein-coupled receptor E3-like [Hoplias malabaricus]|uniref:adhesion G protein-coupled receptor E3-like n=1 Tax=Hoplias malabaricus TaxID=27720 RepID=UPI003462C6D7
MKTLLIFTFSLISGPVCCFDMTGYLSGSVRVYCYHQQYGQNNKYFCKNVTDECMNVQTQNTSVKTPGALTVVCRNLSLQDSGSYRCGETGGWSHDVELKVKRDPCCSGPSAVTGFLGETLTINCSSPEEFKADTKGFYKQDGDNVIIVISTTESQRNRSSISDDRSSKVVSEVVPDGELFCVYWKNTEWVVDGCLLLQSNSNHSVCSCVHLSTFALIMQTRPHSDDEVLCAVLAGVLHFLFLSAFVWMFIEAVLLFLLVKNLTKLRSRKEGFNWKYLVLIGYIIPLIVVGVSAGLVPKGYGSEKCWLKTDAGFVWSFLGPVCFILAANTLLFLNILIIMTSTLKKVASESVKTKRTERDHRLFKSVFLKTMLQFIILGCPWVLGLFTGCSKELETIFLLLNSQKGTFIFLIHCVFNQEVRLLFVRWWRGLYVTRALKSEDDPDTTTSKA